MSFDATLKNYLKEIDEVGLLTWDEERDLANQIIEQNDLAAREHLVRSNLRLVVKIAKGFASRTLPLADLIEEGNLGLLRAVDSFDPEHGVRFCTYASWWIKQSIKRALLLDSGPVHIPTYMVELVNQYRQVVVELHSASGAEPSVKRIAEEMKLPVKKVRAIKQIVDAVSLGGHGESEEPNHQLKDVLADEASQPEDELINGEELGRAVEMLNQIEPRQAEVLSLRFGLGENEPLTLKQIGAKLSLTRERVRQIQRAGLTALNELMNS